jgi:hypothetical protein
MSKKNLAFAVATAMSTIAVADITLMSPQKPGSGTSVWTEIIAKEFAKTPALAGENVLITYNPGARDMAGPNKFHTTERFKDNTIMVTHGGNGISYVQEPVLYDYTQYDSVCHQNLNIIMGKWKTTNEDEGISHVSGSGMVPEALAMVMMIGGPDKTVEEYIAIFKDKVTWVNGLQGSGRHLAFTRGEVTASRANPAQYISKIQPLVDEGKVETWLHHGILDIENGGTVDDPNYPGKRFEDVFEAKWGVAPSGTLYESYSMIHSWRDAIQKALWVNKGNPNTAKFRLACKQMSENPESIAIFQKKIGKYDWVIGEDGNKTIDVLSALIKEKPLKALVKFNQEALGLNSIYKAERVVGATIVNTIEDTTDTTDSKWFEFWK